MIDPRDRRALSTRLLPLSRVPQRRAFKAYVVTRLRIAVARSKLLRRLALGLAAVQVEAETARLQAAGLISMGVGSYGTPKVISFMPAGSTLPHVSVGRYCSIADDVSFIVNGGHRTEWVTTFPVRARYRLELAFADGHPIVSGAVDVGNDVWIGYGATILGGVTIGDGAVIGAMAVVTNDVPAYAVVAGNPAREIRRRFDIETIQSLLEIRWWNLSEVAVAQNAHVLCAPPDIPKLKQIVSLQESSRITPP